MKSLRDLVVRHYASPAVFFLGSDSDQKTHQRIRDKGFCVVEGRYDVVVYHPEHWEFISQDSLNEAINTVKSLPSCGMLEAGINYPYSHAVVPKSRETKGLMRLLFQLPKGVSFTDIVREADEKKGMSRRGFLKGLAAVAGGAATKGPAGAVKAAAKLSGYNIPSVMSAKSLTSVLKTPTARGVAGWLSRELLYNSLNSLVKDEEKLSTIKSTIKEQEPASSHEIKAIESFLKTVEDMGIDPKIPGDHDGQPEAFYDELSELAELEYQPNTDTLVGDFLSDINYSDYYEEKRLLDYSKWKERRAFEHAKAREYERARENFDDNKESNYEDNVTDDYENSILGDEFANDYDGFDDLPEKGYDEEQDWMGENRVIAIPSLRHFPKAWIGGKPSWLNEIDKILS